MIIIFLLVSKFLMIIQFLNGKSQQTRPCRLATYGRFIPLPAEVFYMFWTSILLPAVIILGMLNNGLVLVVMPQRSVTVSTRLKQVYVLVAAFDMFSVVIAAAPVFLEDGLFFLTKGRLQVRTRTLSDLSCKLFAIGSNLPMISASHLMAYLTVERTIAVGWPLLARRVLTDKFTRLTPAVLVSSIVVAFVLFAIPIEYGLQPLSEWGSTCAPTGDSILYHLFFWYFCLTLYVSHSLTMLVSSLVMVVRLLLNAARRHGLDATTSATSATPQSILRSREVRASLTVAAVALLQCGVYLPCATICMAACIAFESPYLQATFPLFYANMVFVYMFSQTAFTIAHIWNVYIYLVKIPSFRVRLVRLLTFGVLKTHVHNSTSSGNL